MTSHIVFDSSYVSDTWDWFGSILFVMDQELWYDPTMGHNHLREFFSIGWPLCWGILFSVDDGFLSHVHSSEDIRCPFSHWSMRHDWRVSSGVFYTGAYPFRSMMVFRHSCSLEAIRFISHWSTRYDWVIYLMWSQEHSLLVIVDIFLRWLDRDTDTYVSMQRSLVISGFALYRGITLSLAVDLRDISSHWDMLFFFGRGQIFSSHYRDGFDEQMFILIRWCMIGCILLVDVWFGDAYIGA